MGFQAIFQWMFVDNADPRVAKWWLMKDPINLIVMLTSYLIINKILLPAYMKNKQPYDLRGIIKWYNIVEIIANMYVFYGILATAWEGNYHLGCLAPDYSDDPVARRMLLYLWYTVILKVSELIETSFFILRKRDNQASFLHIYHHLCSLGIIWSATKYVGGGMSFVTPLLNTFVHIIMYSYYLGALVGEDGLRKWLSRYKKWLTIVQMLQFTIMLVHSLQVFSPSCIVPKGIMWIYIPNVLGVYYLFYDFFKKTYRDETNVEQTKMKIKNKSR